MKRMILTLILVLCFASVCPAPDIWMDADIALVSVPINILPIQTNDGTIDAGVTWNEAGLDLDWIFTLTDGTTTKTDCPPTNAGTHDLTNLGGGMYALEIPSAGGTSVDNDTEGFGWFTGNCTATLPWRGPTIGFRKASMNNLMVDAGTSTVAAVWTDAMTQANIETYSQTGAEAAVGVAGVNLTEAGGDGDHLTAIPGVSLTVDDILDEPIAGHLTQGTVGWYLYLIRAIR